MKPSLADRLRAVVGPSAGPRVHPDARDGLPPPGLSPGSGEQAPADGSIASAGADASLAAGASAAGLADAAPLPDSRAVRARRAAAVLGGVVDERRDGLCIVVDRRYDADARHGRHRVGDIVDMLRQAEAGLHSLRQAWPSSRAPSGSAAGPGLDGLCAIDLETTGLAGGAGTQAFLVGCARLDGDGIVVRQFLAPGFEFERAQLAALGEWMQGTTHFVTFNGRTFDLPLLEIRFTFNRLAWPWPHLPHLDALHPARRFWRERATLANPESDDTSCSLGVLEKRLMGLHRVGDVPGFEIPARFFQFARDGRAEPLEAVLEHNRLDLLSTLHVSARASMLVVRGPAAAERGHECLGLGRIYERLGQTEGALACYERAAAQGAGLGEAGLRAEALPRLALLLRRAGRAAAAAVAWEALLATRGVSAPIRREAREALAIYHEHRARDFGAARTLVLDALAEPLPERHRTSAQRRLARLERKLVKAPAGALLTAFDDEPF